MAFCKKCGAYIPIDETACPACGFDPEAEARAAREAQAKAEAEAKAARERAEAEERRRKQQEEAWAAQERRREEEARRRAEQRKRWEQDPRNHSYTSGAAQSQYASQRTEQAQGQYASDRTGQTWVPPWSTGQTQSSSSHTTQSYSDMREKARESVDNQSFSILSYLGPLAIIPLILRKDDDFSRYHTNQGMVLFLFEILTSAIGPITWPLSLFLSIKGISNVINGKKDPLPLIGNIKLFR